VSKNRKILYLVTEDWYFLSHRLPMARAARDQGFEVVVATRVDQGREAIENEGFRVIPLSMDRKGKNPLAELVSIFSIARIYRHEKPDIVHHVAMKPILYGSIAAWVSSVPAVVNAFAGMGYVFISNSLLARSLRPIFILLFRFLFKQKGRVLVVQNADDMAAAKRLNLGADDKIYLIRGSGIDTEKFHPVPEPDGVPVVILVGRMLWDKGVGELVDAARMLKERGVKVVVRLIGEPDPANPRAIPESLLKEWVSQGLVEWLGRRDDIAKLMQESNIVVLPSYREGMPKSLLEGAACERALVATDVPGCRDLVTHGANGLLVPFKDAHALADAIERLVVDSPLRKKLAATARQHVQSRYSNEVIADQISKVYRSLIS